MCCCSLHWRRCCSAYLSPSSICRCAPWRIPARSHCCSVLRRSRSISGAYISSTASSRSWKARRRSSSACCRARRACRRRTIRRSCRASAARARTPQQRPPPTGRTCSNTTRSGRTRSKRPSPPCVFVSRARTATLPAGCSPISGALSSMWKWCSHTSGSKARGQTMSFVKRSWTTLSARRSGASPGSLSRAA